MPELDGCFSCLGVFPATVILDFRLLDVAGGTALAAPADAPLHSTTELSISTEAVDDDDVDVVDLVFGPICDDVESTDDVTDDDTSGTSSIESNALAAAGCCATACSAAFTSTESYDTSTESS